MGGFFSNVGKFLFGSSEKHKRKPTLLDQQMPLAEQMWQAGLGPGAGGAFGQSADYYRDLLSNDSETANQMFAPELRRFNQETIPDIAEQFAGMGSGALSSSGFQNATQGAGVDLAERLAAMRANLRSQGASGLSGIGQAGLQNFSQDVTTQPGSQGFLSQVAPAIGNIGAAAFGGPIGAGIGSMAGNLFSNVNPKVGRNTGFYGRGSQIGMANQSSGLQPPNWMNR